MKITLERTAFCARLTLESDGLEWSFDSEPGCFSFVELLRAACIRLVVSGTANPPGWDNAARSELAFLIVGNTP